MKTTEHWDIGSADVVFLSAGFSRCATGNASPLMSDFFAELDSRRYWTLSKYLSECFSYPNRANVEDALLKLDQLCLAPLQGKDAFIDQCRKHQSDVRRELDEYMLERLGNLPIPEDSWAAALLATVSKHTTVVATNCDNVAERVLSGRPGLRHKVIDTNCHHCKMCQILNEECACGGIPNDDPFWRGSLLKLHGSIAWKMCCDANCSATACLIPDQHCRVMWDAQCECCGRQCSPVLVHPSMTKRFEKFRGLGQMWKGAYDALSKCQAVMFFGFSFPTSDSVINEVIRCTLGRSADDLRVAVVDIATDGPINRIAELLRNRKDNVYLSRFDVPADGTKTDWLIRV